MPWLRIDDGFTEHRKIVALKRADRWTWMELLTYCARQGSGHVPAGITDVLRWVTPAFLEQCVAVGLLDPDDRFPTGSAGSHHGYQVHDWLEYNAPKIEGDDLEQRVADALAEYPDASATEVHRMVGGRKQAVLALVKRFRPVPPPVPPQVPGNRQGTDAEPVTRAAARARPHPTPPLRTTSSSVDARTVIQQALDDDDLETATTHLGLTPDQHARALDSLRHEPGRVRAAIEAALAHGTRLAPYVDEILRNGSWPETAANVPKGRRAPDPTATCPDCHEKLGHGHLATCPRMPATLDELEPVARAHEPRPDTEAEPLVELADDDPEPVVGEARA